MSRVSMAMRKQYLHQQMNELNAKARDISRKFMELHKYAASVARGRMTLLALAGMPSGCKGLAEGFLLGYSSAVIPNALNKAAMIWGNHRANGDMAKAATEAEAYKNVIRDMHDNPKRYEETLANLFKNDAMGLNKAKMEDSYKEHMYQEAIKQEEAEYRKEKEAEIKVIEDELHQEQLMNNSRMEAVKQELANVEKAEPESIKRSMGTYA